MDEERKCFLSCRAVVVVIGNEETKLKKKRRRDLGVLGGGQLFAPSSTTSVFCYPFHPPEQIKSKRKPQHI
jgi:hypothetical protein